MICKICLDNPCTSAQSCLVVSSGLKFKFRFQKGACFYIDTRLSLMIAPLKSHRRDMGGAKNWVFTLNNFTQQEVAHLESFFGDRDVNVKAVLAYLCFGYETGENGTPHLQGFVTFTKRVSLRSAKRVLGDRYHLEVAKHLKHAINYCKKDGDFREYGLSPLCSSSRGKRTDLDAFKEAVKSGEITDLKGAREFHSEVYARYRHFVESYLEDQFDVTPMKHHALRVWQSRLLEALRCEPDSRTVHFVVDPKGDAGKSWFAQYLQTVVWDDTKVQIMMPGKRADLAYALQPSIRILFIDAPRSKQGDLIPYDFLECVKNGMVFCSKYESRVKRLNKVHVVVLMNENPDESALSADRYNIVYVTPDTNRVADDPIRVD